MYNNPRRGWGINDFSIVIDLTYSIHLLYDVGAVTDVTFDSNEYMNIPALYDDSLYED